jgi:WD40 repeat protein
MQSISAESTLADTLIAISPDGRYLATVLDWKITILEFGSLAWVREYDKDKGTYSTTTYLAFSADGKYLVSSYGNGRIIFWDAGSKNRSRQSKLIRNMLTQWFSLRMGSIC